MTSSGTRALGLWVAEKLGLSGAKAEAYAARVVQADDMLHVVTNDLMKARVNISRAEVCEAAERFMQEEKK